MAHWVVRQGKYVSLEESYRDERGRPRKRILRRLGNILSTIAYNLKSEPGAAAFEKWLKEEDSRLELEKLMEQVKAQDQRAAFKAATGLDLPQNPPGGPVPIDKPTRASVPAAEEAVKAPEPEATATTPVEAPPADPAPADAPETPAAEPADTSPSAPDAPSEPEGGAAPAS